MNPALFRSEVQQFIRSYTEETSILAFKGSPFKNITVQELMIQIEGFRKTKLKLPTWHQTPGIYFPPKLNLEQTSSEITAKYKASLVSGQSLADITGGFGVDCFYFAEQFGSVTHFEQNDVLSEIARHNFSQLGIENIQTICGDGMKGLSGLKFDVVYADPARRHDSKGKVYFLKDCEPNIPANLDRILAATETVLLKTSPMLDISAGLRELKQVVSLHIVAVTNEVKELLWIIRKDMVSDVEIHTVNFTKEEEQRAHFIHQHPYTAQFNTPLTYLYEPNAALLKAGAFDYLSEAYGVYKLHQHSHLYTSKKLLEFPGRRFKIDRMISYQKKEMRQHLVGKKAHVTTRNFPESVAMLRRKWKIKDGGSTYLFFTTNEANNRIVLICSKIKGKN